MNKRCRIKYIKDKNDNKYLPWQYYNLFNLISIPMINKRPMIKEWNLKNKTIASNYTDESIGILCGPVNNLTIIDIDVKDNGLNYFNLLSSLINSEGLEKINCPIVITPSGGLHLYFKYEDSLRSSIRLNILNKKIGIDVKNNGICVTAPSSINGKEYKWKKNFSLNEKKIEKMPKWFLKFLKMFQ